MHTDMLRGFEEDAPRREEGMAAAAAREHADEVPTWDSRGVIQSE
jgi:hypothetical protein